MAEKLGREQVSMLATMNLHVGTLKEKIEELVRGLRIGFRDASASGELEDEGDAKDKDSVGERRDALPSKRPCRAPP